MGYSPSATVRRASLGSAATDLAAPSTTVRRATTWPPAPSPTPASTSRAASCAPTLASAASLTCRAATAPISPDKAGTTASAVTDARRSREPTSTEQMGRSTTGGTTRAGASGSRGCP
eukprot:3656131-Alexandrium_andersonii.AAC.1